MLRKRSGGGGGAPWPPGSRWTAAIPGHAASYILSQQSDGVSHGVECGQQSGFRKGWEDCWMNGDALNTPVCCSVRGGGPCRA